MAKYAHVDENNKLLGWYDNEIHSSIPEPKILVTDEQWQISIQNNHNHCDNDGVTKYANTEPTSEQKIIEAKIYLTETDWYVIRQADSGKEMPSDIKTKREEARQTISDLEE
jgi:hypothetical protein